jgi:hypothetical protein
MPPLEGVRVIEGSTMKVAEPEPEPAEAVTVWGPATPGGTLKEVENEPESDVGVVALITPSYITVAVTLPANPDPDTVSVEPTLPLVGLRTIEATTENVVV